MSLISNLTTKFKRYFFLVVLAASTSTLQAEDTLDEYLKNYDRDDIHSIHKKLYTKEGRHEFSLGIGGILNNDGYALLVGQYAYHLFENLAIEGAMGAYGFQFQDDNRLMYYQASAAFSPLYGKISLFTWAVANFDIYVVGGGGVVSYSGLADGSSFMGNIGLGQRFFINEYLSFKWEFRDLIYKQNSPGGGTQILPNYSFVTAVSVLFPFKQKY